MSWEGVLKAKPMLRRAIDRIMKDGEPRTSAQIQEILAYEGFKYKMHRSNITMHLRTSPLYEIHEQGYSSGKLVTKYKFKGD